MTKKIADYSYDEMLERALTNLPGKAGPTEVFEVPKAEAIIAGDRTIITNYRKIVEAINREEKLLQRYLVKEFGVPATINESGQLVLHGKFNVMVINKTIDLFVQRYVKCPTCGSLHTRLIKKGKVFILKCEACGAETTLQAF